MCDFSGKLIAWMDGELPEGETTVVERHLDGCAECRSRLTAYRRTSDGFAAYCERAVGVSLAEPGPRIARRVFAATGAAAAVALFFVLLPKHLRQSPAAVKSGLSMTTTVTAATSAPEVRPPAAAGAELLAIHPKPAKAKNPDHVLAANPVQRVVAAPLPVRSVESVPSGPSIEIAISSDAIFPPGAMPEGMSFVANVTLGPDGSAERLGLRPRLAGFERRANQ